MIIGVLGLFVHVATDMALHALCHHSDNQTPQKFPTFNK